MKIPLQCENCGVISDEVEETEDPFAAEVYGDHKVRNLCPDCYYERAMDICVTT